MRDRVQGPRHRRRIRREVRWTVTAVVVLLVVEFLVLPRLGGFRQSLHRVSHINVAWVLGALVLEAAALVAYAQLTYTLLSPGAPSRWRLLRIDLSSLALSHVVPGGTAPGVGLSYRLLSQSGVSTADAGFGLAMQGVGSAVVLNILFWLALVVSLFTNGYHALYTWAAAGGTIMMGAFATVVVALTKGRRRTVETVRQWSQKVPFLDADRLAQGVQRVADRLRDLASQRERLSRAVVWAAANWLFDAACLWLFIFALHGYISPINLMVAYGLANILAAIPLTPGGLGVVEAVLVATLASFHVPVSVAATAVLGYRLLNFWIPIPVGGLSYLSLRFESVGWRQRLSQARDEIVENHPAAASTNGARLSPAAPPRPADDRRSDQAGTRTGAPASPDTGAPASPDTGAPASPATGASDPPAPGRPRPQQLQGGGRSVG